MTSLIDTLRSRENYMGTCKLLSTAALLVLGFTAAHGQSMTLAEVQAAGAKALTAAEIKELVSGAKTEMTLVNGSLRIWTNGADGTFVASRDNGPKYRSTARGTWSVNDDAAYCLTFDWGAGETDGWCRRLYRVEDRYYAYGLKAKPENFSGRYRFSR